MVAGQSQLVATAGRSAVYRSHVPLSRVPGCILHAETSFVGELAEVDLQRMARLGEHRDVGPRAEDAVVQRADEDGPYLRMLEAEPLDGVVELDVHSKVV